MNKLLFFTFIENKPFIHKSTGLTQDKKFIKVWQAKAELVQQNS